MYKIIQFYPSLGLKVRALEFKTKKEAYETINICRNYADVPYVAIDGKGNIFDICTFDMTRQEMANLIEECL